MANLLRGKLNNLSGIEAAELESVDDQKDYCLEDCKLTLENCSKNNWEILYILDNVSKYIGKDFMRTCNASGPAQWWDHKLGLVPDHPSADSLIQRLTNDKRYTVGGKVLRAKPGLYYNVQTYDFSSMYPSIFDVNNLSYETVCCEHDSCRLNNKIPDRVWQIINESIDNNEELTDEQKEEEHIVRHDGQYWICKERVGIMASIQRELRAMKREYKRQKNKLVRRQLKLSLMRYMVHANTNIFRLKILGLKN